uniref:Uncharacterized protein n=1 Tax=Photinus pyralis TaxID=7054 RepID=A0A1Y1MYQ6_PHOPY
MATHALQELIPARLSVAEYVDEKFRLSSLPTLEFDPAHDGKVKSSARRTWTFLESLFTEADEREKDLEGEYVYGWKLFSLMMAITLATFLVLLDMSIILTVYGFREDCRWKLRPTLTRPFHESLRIFIRWLASGGTALRIIYRVRRFDRLRANCTPFKTKAQILSRWCVNRGQS